jgi:alpha-tubulin suppressor-like RCC1 family protein
MKHMYFGWSLAALVSRAVCHCHALALGAAWLLLVLIPQAAQAQAIAAGSSHSLTIRPDGTLWAWGDNSTGQLGDGTTVEKSTPVQIGTATWAVVSAYGNYTLAVRQDGTLWGWGTNTVGQLGNGTTAATTSVPTQVGTATTWKSVSAGGGYALAVRQDGTLWAWGDNSTGQQGNGTTTASLVPVQVGTGTTWQSVSAGVYLSLALRTDGTLWAWGQNNYGQLGIGSTANSSVPVQVSAGTTWASISAGSSNAFAVRQDGTLWSWGYNGPTGQLGNNSTTSSSVPVQVSAGTWTSVRASAGGGYALAVRQDGTLWAWGSNSTGLLGNGTTTSSPVPVQVGTATNWKSVSPGGLHSLGLRQDGALCTWGSNMNGQLGNTDVLTATSFVPVPASPGTSWKTISTGNAYTLAVRQDGTLWAWGLNSNGQLGDGTTIEKSTPVQIGTATNWASASTGISHSLALRTDGTLWAWGNNTKGQLGNGTTTSSLVPVQVGTSTTWVSTSVGYAHSLALRSDGTLWAWGTDTNGELGTGTTSAGATSAPVQVGTATTWASISAGFAHSLALSTDGTLWAWGSNGFGQLGNATTTNSTAPVQVSVGTTWLSIGAGYYHSLALRSDGTLWAWGSNSYGQLGNGTTSTGSTTSAPAQVGTATNWVSLSASSSHSLALRSDGTLWAWGNNENGQLGNGTTTNSPAPTQVGTDANWQRIGAGNNQSVALRTDGTLWAWGSNSYGQLGRPSSSTTPLVSFVSVLAVSVLSTSAELPGQAVTITGTGFTSASTVTFGGIAASSVTYVSPTQLTAVVPVGMAAGSSAIVVSTDNISSNSASSPAFEALQVYRAPAASGCLNTDGISITGSGGPGTWRYLRLPTAQGGAVVAAIEDTYNLGTVSVGFQAMGTSTSAPVRTDKGRAYLDRNFYLTATNQTFPGQRVRVRFFGLSSELSRLTAADGTVTAASLKVSQYAGANEDCTPGNNDGTGEIRTLAAPATVLSGTDWFTAEVTVADHFSEFYLTGNPAPLPVQLTAFTAALQGPAIVRLAWTTASEQHSAYYEVERSTDGVNFHKIGEVAAAGTSTMAHTYHLSDAALLTGAPTFYYRLRQVDLDGNFTYSPVRTVLVGASSLALFPNPAQSHQVTLVGAAPGQFVQVYNALGRLVLTATADAGGTASLALPASWPAGIYVVRAQAHALRLHVE